MICIVELVLVDISLVTLVQRVVTVIGIVLVNATVVDVVVLIQLVTEVVRVVAVVDSVLVDVGGAVTVWVTEASNGTVLDILLAEVALWAVAVAAIWALASNHTAVTVGDAEALAFVATVATDTVVAWAWARRLRTMARWAEAWA